MGRSPTSRSPDGLLLVLSFRLCFFVGTSFIVSKTKYHSIVFFSHACTTTSGSWKLGRECVNKGNCLSLSRFTLSRASSNCKVRGRVVRVR
uniref:Putative secreted protein n=1 Tax=Ixodes ricinus TaxID=34613 RepID=A0A6B0UGT3_IXORI